ncbi:hypothetical protein QYE76_065350 [Lolium multiflorum]|uniref:FRIGIDA-like protein n=1 Tax=Lolium multiflorum TaxID=4521 RepID=A0AAD8S942_LOLMU|nr:hypothetical protein QYE76_065350 [Lolium multiflorum]
MTSTISSGGEIQDLSQDINMLKKMGFSKKENALVPQGGELPKASNQLSVAPTPYPRAISFFLLFLLFLKVEKWRNVPLSKMTTKVPLALLLKSRPLMKEFIRLGTQFVGYRDYTKKLEGDLAESNKRADALAVKLKQSEENRQKAEKDAAAIEDLRKRLHKAETSLSDNITQQSAREAEILSRLESQCRRFVRRTHQEYEVDGPVGDELLDALTLVEIHGDEARDGLENAEAGLLKLFPYFFPKKETPSTFVELAKTFNGPEDLGLKLRQEGLKIGVECTIALTAKSQQDVDWAKVGNIGEMETKKWQSLIRAAKPSAIPILSFLGVKPAPAPSASKPEVK